jgi:hypothetical protein
VDLTSHGKGPKGEGHVEHVEHVDYVVTAGRGVVEREAFLGEFPDPGTEAVPGVIMEQAWPRRAPRVVLGCEVLGRWCRPLGRAVLRPPVGAGLVTSRPVPAAPPASDGGFGGVAGG